MTRPCGTEWPRSAVEPKGRRVAKIRVLYVINSQPLITVGPGSYIHQMIGLAGGINIASGANAPYPRLTWKRC